jgi:hypothetical protein
MEERERRDRLDRRLGMDPTGGVHLSTRVREGQVAPSREREEIGGKTVIFHAFSTLTG